MPTGSDALGASLDGWARALAALTAAASSLGGPDRWDAAPTLARGYFRPEDEDRLVGWFARFLTVRAGLWELLGEVRAALPRELHAVEGQDQWRAAVCGYASACALVGLDRLLVEELAVDGLVQRKLNEGAPERRIPRKQFTAVYESLSEPRGALALLGAMRFVERNRARIEALGDDPVVGELVRSLPELECALDPSKRRFMGLVGGFASHALRRRGAVARERATFALLEAGGRTVSELRDRSVPKLAAPVVAELGALLRPGDVLVTRHERALTNLFLPGHWPHVALYVGTRADRERLGVQLDAERATRWDGDRCVLEALKDGVLFRPLAETLAVNAVAVIRPRLAQGELAAAFARAAAHEGKGYNFDFDFLRSDRLVCTEVVYRAYDGLGGIEIPLTERAGRPTLSAEDLLDLALAGRGFEPLALVAGQGAELIHGPAAAGAIEQTYREPG